MRTEMERQRRDALLSILQKLRREIAEWETGVRAEIDMSTSIAGLLRKERVEAIRSFFRWNGNTDAPEFHRRPALKAHDDAYEHKVITSVEATKNGWTITSHDGWAFFCPNRRIVPLVGSIGTYYGDGIGRPVRGLDIDFQEVFYRTEDEQKAEHRKQSEKHEKERRTSFETHRDDYDARYDSLPLVFQRRIDRFRQNNPDFRWEYEGYEAATCIAAVSIAQYAQMEGVAPHEIAGLPHDTIDGWIDDATYGYSGNQVDCARALARAYLEAPRSVIEMHGAMTPLVGCQAYGCLHERVTV